MPDYTLNWTCTWVLLFLLNPRYMESVSSYSQYESQHREALYNLRYLGTARGRYPYKIFIFINIP